MTFAEAYQAFHRSNEVREIVDGATEEYEVEEIRVPKNLRKQVRVVLKKHADLRWDEALKVVLDDKQLDHVRAEKKRARQESGDFTDDDDEENEEDAAE